MKKYKNGLIVFTLAYNLITNSIGLVTTALWTIWYVWHCYGNQFGMCDIAMVTYSVCVTSLW